MFRLHQARCLNHATREAVARCSGCENFFCRECVTEHAGHLMCAACIVRFNISGEEKSHGLFFIGFSVVKRLVVAVLNLFVIWMFFYALGRLLLLIPDSFHPENIGGWWL